MCLSTLQAEKWKNPANKYINAHKKYQDSNCPIALSDIQHFVYFARDRSAIIDHQLLKHPRFSGAQIMYAWKDLEPEKDRYDFSHISDDIAYLNTYDKKLFIQLQDATFNPSYNAAPDYLKSPEYAGGSVMQYNDNGEEDGWVAKRWHPKVQLRFAKLLMAMGQQFDGKIAGINLQETSIVLGTEQSHNSDFTELAYVEGLKTNMKSLKVAFPQSDTMIYANFIPGEWLPFEDKGYLKSIYQYGEDIGVGLGGPDLMVTRKGQLNHALAQMHEHQYSVPLGIAIQDGNYIAKTGSDIDYNEYQDKGQKGRKNLVPLLHAFAKDFLKVDYVFWVDQKPYFQQDVLTCLQ